MLRIRRIGDTDRRRLGKDGIPLRDELELELPIAAWPHLVERHQWPST